MTNTFTALSSDSAGLQSQVYQTQGLRRGQADAIDSRHLFRVTCYLLPVTCYLINPRTLVFVRHGQKALSHQRVELVYAVGHKVRHSPLNQ
jgi:hypothetical protein